MPPASGRSFAMTNLVANRVLFPVLTSGAGRLLGGRFAVVEYQGRRSGQRHRLVTQYATAERTAERALLPAEEPRGHGRRHGQEADQDDERHPVRGPRLARPQALEQLHHLRQR